MEILNCVKSGVTGFHLDIPPDSYIPLVLITHFQVMSWIKPKHPNQHQCYAVLVQVCVSLFGLVSLSVSVCFAFLSLSFCFVCFKGGVLSHYKHCNIFWNWEWIERNGMLFGMFVTWLLKPPKPPPPPPQKKKSKLNFGFFSTSIMISQKATTILSLFSFSLNNTIITKL